MLHAQALACLMFTAGKVGHELAPEAAQAARRRVVHLQHSFSPQDVSATLQGFAAQEIDAPEVFRALMDRVRTHLGGFARGSCVHSVLNLQVVLCSVSAAVYFVCVQALTAG